MKDLHLLEVNKRHLGTICLGVIVIILFAGLWPHELNFENQVALLKDGNGVHFSGRGILYSLPLSIRRPLHINSTDKALTIEMAVQADKEWKSSLPFILAIDDGQPCERLIIGQWINHLIIKNRRKACFQSGDYAELDLDNSLIVGKLQFITITSGSEGTALYLNGSLVKKKTNLSLLRPGEMLSGRLVLGNSSAGNQSWAGTVSALALYDTTLSSEEVLRDYESWRDSRSISPRKNDLPFVDYRFDELTGPVVKDHSGQGNDLLIPEHFSPPHHRMLTLPWDDFHVSGAYARDIAINILGFIPFGFYIAWYLSVRGVPGLRVIILVMLLGAGISLFIEVAQAYLPDRYSQLTDVITNTFGTAIGIYLWRRYIYRARL